MKTQPTPGSQCAKILRTLKIMRGWQSMPLLCRVSGSYNVHSRIDELRHRYGCRIENKKEHCGKKINSYYRLKK